MFLFRLAVSFGAEARGTNDAAEILGAWPIDPPDGVATARARYATAGIARWAVIEADRETVPIHDLASGLLVAGDVRLHNRRELRDILQVAPAESVGDLEIVLRAFRRWSEDTPRHLVGDFAFAIWNDRTRGLFAARDHLGVRPLYYCKTADGLFLASDVRQLFSTAPGLGHRLDLDRIQDRFARRYRQHGHSYFRDIALVRPGHVLIGTGEGLRESRYWFPPATAERAPSYAENCERLRAHFLRAVEDRLESDRPLIVHSSGGFDSSTIVMAADALYRSTPSRAPLVTASALTPGTECDDGRYIEAVSRRTSFEAVTWNALEFEATRSFNPSLAAPYHRSGPGGGRPGDFELAHQRGARVLISGFGGDEVKLSGGIFRDLSRNLRWIEIGRDPSFKKALAQSWRAIPRVGLGFLSPRGAVEFLAWFGTREPKRPFWVGPALEASWSSHAEDLELPELPWKSHVACDLWSRMTRPHVSSLIDSVVLRATDEGLELRLPFLDVRLVEHLLGVPWEQRIPHGDLRRMARDTFETLLPVEFADRKGQGSWQSVWASNARAMLPATRNLMEAGPWQSAPYIDFGAARRLVERVATRGERADPAESMEVANIGTFEAWIRAVLTL